MEITKFFFIGFGGFVGANLRYLVQGWAADRWGATLPYGTMFANVSGSFVLAFFVTLTLQRLPVGPGWRLFFAVGLLGGYTTFSTFAVETVALLQSGQWLAGGVNFFGNTLLGLAAALLGIWAAQLL